MSHDVDAGCSTQVGKTNTVTYNPETMRSVFKRMSPLAMLAACVSIIANFQGAATAISLTLPMAEAFLPIVAVAGAVFSAGWAVIISWDLVLLVRSRTAAGRFALMVDQLRAVLTVLQQSLVDVDQLARAFGLIVELKYTLETEFAIPCPGMKESTDDDQTLEDMLLDWLGFVSILIPRAKLRQLSAARRALDDLDLPLRPSARWTTD